MNTFKTIKSESLDPEILLSEIAKRDQKIIHLEEQIEWFKRQIFGKRSERVVSNLNAQQLIFEGFESPASNNNQKKTVAAHERNKPRRDGKDKISLPDDLPVRTTIIDVSEMKKFARKQVEHSFKLGLKSPIN